MGLRAKNTTSPFALENRGAREWREGTQKRKFRYNPDRDSDSRPSARFAGKTRTSKFHLRANAALPNKHQSYPMIWAAGEARAKISGCAGIAYHWADARRSPFGCGRSPRQEKWVADARIIGKSAKSSPGCRILSNLCLFLILRGTTMRFSGFNFACTPRIRSHCEKPNHVRHLYRMGS